MLRQLRSKNLKKWILIGLLLIVIPSFISFYGWRETDVKSASGPAVVIKYGYFDKVEIPRTDLKTAEGYLRNRVRSYMQQNGIEDDDGLIQQVSDIRASLDQAISLALVERYAKENGISVSQDEAMQTLKNSIPLQMRNQFMQYIAREGMTLDDYAARQRQGMLIDKVRDTLGSQVRATDYEAWLRFLTNKEKFVVDYVRLDSANYLAKVDPKDEELKSYFEKNKTKFRIPEQVQYAYVTVNKNDLKSSMTISEDQITSYFNANQEDFRLPRQVHARQIFLKRPSSRDIATTDTVTSAIQRVRQTAIDLFQRAAKGEDFAKLADQYSQETMFPPREETTATDAQTTAGGNLGFVTETMARAAYGEAWTSSVLSMQPGSIHPPIETPRGFFVVKLEALKEGTLRSLEQVRDDVKERLLDQLVEPEFERVGKLLREEAKRPTLEAVAEATSQTLTVSPKVDRRPKSIPGLGDLNELAENVGDLQRGARSDELLSDANRHLLIELREEFPAKDPAFDEVRDKVLQAYKQEKARELAKADADKIKESGTNPEKFKTAVADAGLTTTRSRPFVRLEAESILGPISDFRDVAAGIKKQEVVLSPLGDKNEPSGYVIWQMVDRIAPEQSDFRKELGTLAGEISQEKKELVYNEFLRTQRERLGNKIEINPAYR